MKVRFNIAEEKFFNNGKIILSSMRSVRSRLQDALSSVESVEEKGPGQNRVKADSLNRALRRCLVSRNITCETYVEDGVFFHSGNKGFDLAFYDEEYNLARLYNNHLGSVGMLDGDKKILSLYKKMGCDKEEWRKTISSLQSKVPFNTDLVVEKKHLTVVGELQFGNASLLHTDLFRLLNAEADPGVDLYIYITAADTMSRLISDGTVSYRKADEVITENLSVLKTPIWLIGLNLSIL